MKVINTDNVISRKFIFYDKKTQDQIKVKSIHLDAHGTIDKITAESHNVTFESTSEDFVYTNLILEIPSLGTAVCGDLIYLQVPRKPVQEYTLQFGWHTNVSNQKIYSWYLVPFLKNLDTHELPKAKTLYYDDLCNIIGVSNKLSCCLPTDVEQEISNDNTEEVDF